MISYQNVTDETIGNKVRAARLLANMTQTDLSKKLNVSFQQLQKYEKGKNRIPITRLLKICLLTNKSILFFLERDSNEEDTYKKDRLEDTYKKDRLIDADKLIDVIRGIIVE